jgi:hypothetical protein
MNGKSKVAEAILKELRGIEPIHKDDLPGKYIEYRDRKGMFRISKVVKVNGLSGVSVHKPGRKKAIPVKKEDIVCNVHHGHCRRPIEWSIRRKKNESKAERRDSPEGWI